MSTTLEGPALFVEGNHDQLDVPVEEAFAWQEIVTSIEASERERRDDLRFSLANRALYLVVFESTRDPGADPLVIAELDDAAHREASESDSLLYYHAGMPDEDGRSRSWCLWTDDKAAREAVSGPAHQEAMERAGEFYGKNYAVKLFSVIPHDEGIVFVPHSHSTAR